MRLRFLAFVLLAVLCCPSCALLLNRRMTHINIYTNPDSALVSVGDSVCYYSPVHIVVPRSKKDLTFTIRKDSLVRNIVVRHRLSPAYTIGNGLCLWTGYGLDLLTPKRFTYDHDIFVDLTKTVRPPGYRKGSGDYTGVMRFTTSRPEGNFYALENDRGEKTSLFGFQGVTAGLEHHLTRRNFLAGRLGFTVSFPTPFPFPSYADSIERAQSEFAELSIGRVCGEKFFLSAGMHLSYLQFERSITDTLGRLVYDSTVASGGVGLSLHAEYQFKNQWAFGLSYHPVQYQLEKQKWEYAHVIFLELTFKIDFYRPYANRAWIRMPISLKESASPPPN